MYFLFGSDGEYKSLLGQTDLMQKCANTDALRANGFDAEIFILAVVAVLCTAEGENGDRNRKI